jgi:hypothetical protein
VIITRNASFLLSPGRELRIGLVLMKMFFFFSKFGLWKPLELWILVFEREDLSFAIRLQTLKTLIGREENESATTAIIRSSASPAEPNFVDDMVVLVFHNWIANVKFERGEMKNRTICT